MLVGYARVSTQDQDTALQRAARSGAEHGRLSVFHAAMVGCCMPSICASLYSLLAIEAAFSIKKFNWLIVGAFANMWTS